MLQVTKIAFVLACLLVFCHFSRSLPIKNRRRRDDLDSFWNSQLLTPECRGEDCIKKGNVNRIEKKSPCLEKRCQEDEQTERTRECQQDEDCDNKKSEKINRRDKERSECQSGKNCERMLDQEKGESQINDLKVEQNQKLKKRILSSSLSKCPLGKLGCGKKRKRKHQSECPSGCKREKETQEDQSECPPGLWCKRGLNGRDAKKMGFLSSDQLSGCPPGLWCKRENLISEDQLECPPGLWCKKGLNRRDAKKMGFLSSDQLSGCPPGLWCKRENRISEDQSECPPGLWCKRGLDKKDAKKMGFQSSNQRSDCPPGLWCIRKRETLEDQLECPPGLWCTRGLKKSEVTFME